MWKILLVAGLVSTGATGAAADAITYPIAPIISATGNVQELFAFQVREALKASHTFRYTTSSDLGFHLRLSMMNGPSPVQFIVYSFTMTFQYKDAGGELVEAFLDTDPGYCGVTITQSCAQTIVARASEDAEKLMEAAAKPTLH